MASTAELIFRITPQAGDFKSTMAQVRSELNQTGQTQTTVAKGELSTRQQLAAVQSLQRQRSAAMIAEWKRSEKAAQDAARGVIPFRDSLQQLGNSMQTLRGSVAALEGPLGGIAGRLGSVSALMGSLSTETTAAGTSIASVAGPIGIAAAAIVGLTVAGVALSKQFIDLTFSTAEWQGKLFDLSQQTGVSVETLSALEAVAETTGGSIESVAQSLVIFQGNLDDAQNSASKTGKLFTELGISTNNTEQAFRDALRALAAMPEGFKQTNDAAELFGRRGGKQVLAILKETQGDIDGTIEKLRGLNSLVTTDVARGADQLNDQLRGTQRQFRGLQAQIVNESMPMIVRALQDLSRILRENREAFILLGQAISLFLQGNLRLVAPAVTIASAAFEGHRRAVLPLIEAYQRLAAVMQLVTNSVPNIDPNAIPAVGAAPVISFGGSATVGKGITREKGSGGGGGGGSARSTALDDATKEAELAERELRQKIEADVAENKRALDEQARDIEEFTRRAIELAEQRHDAVIVRVNAEIAALDQAHAKKLISQREYNHKNRELDIENAEAAQKFADEKWELEQKRDRQIADAELAAHKRSAQMAEEASDRLLTIIQDKVDRQVISELEAEQQIAPIIAQGFERRKKLLEDELTRITTSLERKKDINQELINLERERADAVEDSERRIREAREGELSQRPRRVRDATRPRSVEEDEFGKPIKDISIWEEALAGLGDHMDSFENAALHFNEVARTYIVGAFQGMAAAAQDAIQAWILYGGSLGKALKQALAAELAAIAARAAIQAALHAAYAIGSLAFGNFAAAAQHGLAAAKFAAVAALTGIAARGLAVSAAGAQSGGVTAGSAFQSASTPRSQAGQPTTIDVNRRTSAQPAVNVIVRLQGDIASDALKMRVVDAVVESLDLNDARLTTQIQGAAQRAR